MNQEVLIKVFSKADVRNEIGLKRACRWSRFFPLNQKAPSSLSRGSCVSSECDRCRCQCSLPDHVDSVSQKTPQTLQTAPETHHGVSIKPQRRSRSEVRVHRDTYSEIFLHQEQAGIKSPSTNFFPLVLFWCSSRTRPRVTSLTPSYSWLTSLFYVASTRNTSRVSWWTWPSTPSPTSPFRG